MKYLYFKFNIFGMARYALKIRAASISKAKLLKEQQKVRNDQLAAAVQYCRKNNCRGFSAVKYGLFPLIKDCRTINKRLDGLVVLEDESKEYCR